MYSIQMTAKRFTSRREEPDVSTCYSTGLMAFCQVPVTRSVKKDGWLFPPNGDPDSAVWYVVGRPQLLETCEIGLFQPESSSEKCGAPYPTDGSLEWHGVYSQTGRNRQERADESFLAPRKCFQFNKIDFCSILPMVPCLSPAVAHPLLH